MILLGKGDWGELGRNGSFSSKPLSEKLSEDAEGNSKMSMSRQGEIDDQGYLAWDNNLDMTVLRYIAEMAGLGFFHDEKDFDSPQRREEHRVDGERGSLQFALTCDKV